MSVIEQFQQLEAHASRLIIGQAHLINRMLIALLCDGHLLVEGAPGLAKNAIGGQDNYLISGVLYCVAPLAELKGSGGVTLTDLNFS